MPLLNNDDLIKQWELHKGISEGSNNYQHGKAREAHLYHAGDESVYRSSVQDKGVRNQVVFNKIKPFVDSVKGFMIQLRRKPKYLARVIGSEKQEEYSSYMNSVSDYIRSNGNMDQLESRQDLEMLIAGYGAIDSNILYEKNPDGEVVGENIRYSDIFWDPQSQEQNLLDSRWVFRRKAYGMKEALKRFKGSNEEDFERYDPDTDNGYSYIPGGEYDKSTAGGKQEDDLVEVYYYQYWKLEKYFRALNPLFESELDEPTLSLIAEMLIDMMEKRSKVSEPEDVEDVFEFDPLAEFLIMTPTIYKDVKFVFEKFGLEIEALDYLKKTYYTAILSGTKVFKKFKSPDQQGYSIKFKTGNFDPVKRLWYGMVAAMIEPSKYANKALSEILYVIASNSKGGVMYEDSAVDDPKRFEQQYASTKAAIKVNDGALSGNRIQPKAVSALPTGYENIYQVANQSLDQVSGISREFLGTSANTQVSALLETQRINQVIATLAGYFDSISLFQKEQARLMTTYIRMLAENSKGRLVALIGEDGAKKYDVLSEDRIMDEYDIDITEAPITPAQQQETAKVLSELSDKLFQTGKNIYPLVIDYIPGIKEVDKLKIKQAILPNSEEVQAQEQIAQRAALREHLLQESLMNSQNAKSQKDLADTEKTKADIEKINVEVKETLANTVKIIEEAKQKSVENELLKSRSAEDINVVI